MLPFINALGYDIFDPTEVIPEFTADVGIKKGEKVDYALIKDGKIIMLFECKHCGADLNSAHASQLYRYFSVTEARIAVLTNGIEYRFFSDLEASNKMDDKPFLVLSMLDLQEPLVNELKKLTKPVFNLDEILSVAGELKYTREIKRILGEQASAPSDELLKFFATQLQLGTLTQARKERLAEMFRRGFSGYINDQLNERLKSALGGNAPAIEVPEAASVPATSATGETSEATTEKGVVTTEEEREAFYIIKSILRQYVDPIRITARDTQSYFGILLDNNNRKPLARLHFNNKTQKYVGVFNADRSETRVPITDLNAIFEMADQLKAVLAFYEKGGKSAAGNGESGD